MEVKEGALVEYGRCLGGLWDSKRMTILTLER
jgi:hypothetical protein